LRDIRHAYGAKGRTSGDKYGPATRGTPPSNQYKYFPSYSLHSSFTHTTQAARRGERTQHRGAVAPFERGPRLLRVAQPGWLGLSRGVKRNAQTRHRLPHGGVRGSVSVRSGPLHTPSWYDIWRAHFWVAHVNHCSRPDNCCKLKTAKPDANNARLSLLTAM
jgi:hypothetical protein